MACEGSATVEKSNTIKQGSGIEKYELLLDSVLGSDRRLQGKNLMSFGTSLVFLTLFLSQTAPEVPYEPSEAEVGAIRQKTDLLNERITTLKKASQLPQQIADVEVCAKAGEWILRHREFFAATYPEWTINGLDIGLQRVSELSQGKASWFPKAGSTVLGYYSQVDGSVQPYAVTLPPGYEENPDRRWPLHVHLHGRNAKLNEVSFLHEFEGKPLKEEVNWVQLEIYGRTNNAFRWAGEADVFEAMQAVKQRVKIDEDRITLLGFSMGGAATWHLGLHYPTMWSSIGSGAGFIDTVHHMKIETPLSPLHQKLVKIYDGQEYALNAFNVPTIGYGGDLDPLLYGAMSMHQKGKELGVPIQLLIGPETAHKFHPDSLKEFLAFLAVHSEAGRASFPKRNKLRFITYTLKYHRCEWMAVEEQVRPYEPTVIEAEVDLSTKVLTVSTSNAAMLSIQRQVADSIVIDRSKPLSLKSDNNHPMANAYVEKRSDGWHVLDSVQAANYVASGTESNFNNDSTLTRAIQPGSELRKRHNLQGPIDDAFMQPFVCVRPTGTAWSEEQTAWARWSLERFEQEFDKRMRGKVRVVDDTQVTDEMMVKMNLILFGDPGSNSIVAKIVDKLPIHWTKTRIDLQKQSFDCSGHGVALIYPNPLNPTKYVVVNSGHTMHEREFSSSNAALYPRLGDYAVIKFTADPKGGFQESVLKSDLFDARWRFASE